MFRKYFTAINLIGFVVFLLTIIFNIAFSITGPLNWITSLGAVGSVWLMTKMDKNFIYFDLVWCVGMILTAIPEHLYFDIVLYTFYFFMAFVQYANWNKSRIKNNKISVKHMNNKKLFKTIGLIIALVLFFGTLMTISKDPNPYLDATYTLLAIFGVYFIAQRYYVGQVFLLISDLLIAILYINRGLISVSISYFLITAFTLTALVKWRNHFEN